MLNARKRFLGRDEHGEDEEDEVDKHGEQPPVDIGEEHDVEDDERRNAVDRYLHHAHKRQAAAPDARHYPCDDGRRDDDEHILDDGDKEQDEQERGQEQHEEHKDRPFDLVLMLFEILVVSDVDGVTLQQRMRPIENNLFGDEHILIGGFGLVEIEHDAWVLEQHDRPLRRDVERDAEPIELGQPVIDVVLEEDDLRDEHDAHEDDAEDDDEEEVAHRERERPLCKVLVPVWQQALAHRLEKLPDLHVPAGGSRV